MVGYTSSVHVARDPSVVFTYLIEPAKQALWSGVPMRRLTDGPLGTGSRFEVAFGMGLIKARIVLELTAVEVDRRMAFRTVSGPIDWTGEYRLAPGAAGGTELSQSGTLQFGGLWRLLEPIVGAEIKGGEIKELEKLRAVAEAG
jgi:hypothetical protein